MLRLPGLGVVLQAANIKAESGCLSLYSLSTTSPIPRSIAVGGKAFIETVKDTLGFRAKGRKIIHTDDTFELREVIASYGKADHQKYGNTYLWNNP